MITKREVIDKIEILEDGVIQVRKALYIDEDGTELVKAYHRYCICPGDITDSETGRVKKVVDAIWDSTTVKDYKDKMNNRRAANEV